MGPEMMQRFRDQAERFGARLITDEADRVELATEPGGVHEVCVGDEEHRARTVILAMGAEHKKLGVPGEEELSGGGISYCATCDAAFFKDTRSSSSAAATRAMEEAIFLAKFGKRVTVVNRRAEFRASKIMIDRAREQENLEFLTPYVVEAFLEGEGPLQRVARLRNAETDEIRGDAVRRRLHRDRPRAAVLGGRRGQVDLDENGYVVTEGSRRGPTLPGVFAAGDLVDHTYRQAITAAGSGCQAALDAEWYLRDTPEVPTPDALPARRPRRGAVGRRDRTPPRLQQCLIRRRRLEAGEDRLGLEVGLEAVAAVLAADARGLEAAERAPRRRRRPTS